MCFLVFFNSITVSIYSLSNETLSQILLRRHLIFLGSCAKERQSPLLKMINNANNHSLRNILTFY